MKEGKDQSDLNRTYREIAPYIGLGTQLAVTVTAMVFVGIWLDGKFNTNPILTILGAFIGVFVGMYHFIKSVTKNGK